MYKRGILVVILALVMSVTALAEDRDTEMDHVIVTLADGSTVEGYITTYWSETGIFKGYNQSFKMATTPDGTGERRYTADEVQSVRFVKQTGDDSDDGVMSADVANPTTFQPKKVVRQFVHKEDSTSVGEIFWWNGIDRQQMQLGSMQISTIYGVRLRGDDVIIPFMTGNIVSLNAMRIVYKKKDKKLVDYVDRRILKGGNKLWALMAKYPSMILDIVADYYGSGNGYENNQ